MLYDVKLNLAPSGGRRLNQGERVEISEEELGPYVVFIQRRWLVPVYETGETEHANVTVVHGEQLPEIPPDGIATEVHEGGPLDEPPVLVEGDTVGAEGE